MLKQELIVISVLINKNKLAFATKNESKQLPHNYGRGGWYPFLAN